MHLRSLGFRTTASAVVGTAAVAAVGDVLTVENGTPGTQISILDWWGLQNTNPGFQQLIYPSGHDTTRGIRGITAGATVTVMLAISGLEPARWRLRSTSSARDSSDLMIPLPWQWGQVR